MLFFPSLKKIIWRTLLAALFLFALLAAAAGFFPQKFLCMDSGKVSADVIIVLGGGSHERPLRAAELFKERAAPRIIITGVGDDGINRRLLLQAGVPAAVIQVEGKSETTRENAMFTIKLLREQKVQSVILVTSWYHARRAQKTFQHYAPEIKFYSRPSYGAFERAEWKQKGWKEKGITRRIYLEYVKLPGYWICYGVWPY